MPDDRAAVQFHAVVGTVRREFGFYGPFSLLYLHLLPKMETRKCRPTVPDRTTEKTQRVKVCICERAGQRRLR